MCASPHSVAQGWANASAKLDISRGHVLGVLLTSSSLSSDKFSIRRTATAQHRGRAGVRLQVELPQQLGIECDNDGRR